MEGDFLLLELRDLLKNHPRLKVVLMSATINHETFVKYFNGAPLLTIPGSTYPVTDRWVSMRIPLVDVDVPFRYLEDILPVINYRPPNTKLNRGENAMALKELRDSHRAAGISDDVITAIQAINRSGRIDYTVISIISFAATHRLFY